MAVKLKKTGEKASLPIGITVGMLTAILITVLSASITALLIADERLPESAIGYAAVLMLLVSAGAGALIGSAVTGHRRMLVCLLTGCGYYALLLSCTALFFGGIYEGVGVTALVILAAVLSCSLLGLKNKKTVTRSKRRTGNR